MRAPILASALAAVLLAPSIAGAQASGPRIVVTPANPRMVAKDTLRLAASVVDENGKAIPGIKVRYFGGGAFEAHVDSTGLVTSGAVGKFPVVISALVRGRARSRRRSRC